MNINDADFFQKLRSTFEIEAHDHLRTISLSILELEKETVEEEKVAIIETIHREFHSLKGAARAVSEKEIETLCHSLENTLTKIKKGSLTLKIEIFDIFNEAIDIIENLLSSVENKAEDISSLMDKLTTLEDYSIGPEEELKTNNLDHKELNEESIDSKIKINDVEQLYEKDLEEKKSLNTIEYEALRNNIKINEERELIDHNNIKLEIKTQNSNANKIPQDKTGDILRVSKEKLDSLLLQGEELIFAKLSAIQRAKDIRNLKDLLFLWKKEKNNSYISTLEEDIDQILKATENDAKTIEAMTDAFMEDIKNIMILPFSSIIEMFPKMVRDLARNLDKDIEFLCKGTEIEVDRRILEEIKVPLMHIIRNSVDHGIESNEERLSAGKPVKGNINLHITQVNSEKVKIEIWDDGRGIDLHKLKEKAVKNKLYTSNEANNMDEDIIKSLIFKSGISTSDIITDISGRGLGLAIVNEKIQDLGGSIKVHTEKLKGTRFIIMLPITVSTNRGIIAKASNQVFVIPTGKVERAIRVKRDEIKIIENKATILLEDEVISVISLKDILELQEKKIEEYTNEVISILVVKDLDRKIAFGVDEIIGEQEVLVKRFNKQLKRVRNISGATILGSGEVVPILDVQDLIKSSYKHSSKSINIISNNNKGSNKGKSIIVVEDSITSRTLLKSILESCGFLVKTAVDGLEGWNLLNSEKFDLVITDVEMPKMDGFELTSKIRNHSEFSEIPVVLVTSLESREHKERGIDVGASAYIVKSDFQQGNLLDTIKRLI
jgi:two-component system chemotaxis sensor kinase CheA